jgi:hypothetical protein
MKFPALAFSFCLGVSAAAAAAAAPASWGGIAVRTNGGLTEVIFENALIRARFGPEPEIFTASKGKVARSFLADWIVKSSGVDLFPKDKGCFDCFIFSVTGGKEEFFALGQKLIDWLEDGEKGEPPLLKGETAPTKPQSP